MDNISRKSSERTPYIHFDYNEGRLTVKGRSMPEDSEEFYSPLRDWMTAYARQPQQKTTVDMSLEYFNTGSCVHLVAFFQCLETLQNSGKSEIDVNWYYEEYDVDMQETGKEFSDLFTVPIKTIAVEAFEIEE